MRTIHIAAAIILDNFGNMLVVKKKNTIFFMQPGGKIEAGETAIETLKRELKEEIGSEIVDANYIGKFSAPAANEPDHVVEAEMFETILSNEAAPAAEISEINWVNIENTSEINLAPLTKLLLKEIAKQH